VVPKILEHSIVSRLAPGYDRVVDER